MAVTPRQAVSVGTSATRLDADPTDRKSGVGVLLVPQASGTLILGGPAVTAANGCRVPVTAGQPITVDLDQGESLYGIVASGTLAVDVLLVGA